MVLCLVTMEQSGILNSVWLTDRDSIYEGSSGGLKQLELDIPYLYAPVPEKLQRDER